MLQASRIKGYMVYVADCNIVKHYIGIIMSHESNAAWELKTVLELDQDYSTIKNCSRIKRING